MGVFNSIHHTADSAHVRVSGMRGIRIVSRQQPNPDPAAWCATWARCSAGLECASRDSHTRRVHGLNLNGDGLVTGEGAIAQQLLRAPQDGGHIASKRKAA